MKNVIPISSPTPEQLQAFGRAFHTLLQHPDFRMTMPGEVLHGSHTDRAAHSLLESITTELASKQLITLAHV